MLPVTHRAFQMSEGYLGRECSAAWQRPYLVCEKQRAALTQRPHYTTRINRREIYNMIEREKERERRRGRAYSFHNNPPTLQPPVAITTHQLHTTEVTPKTAYTSHISLTWSHLPGPPPPEPPKHWITAKQKLASLLYIPSVGTCPQNSWDGLTQRKNIPPPTLLSPRPIKYCLECI